MMPLPHVNDLFFNQLRNFLEAKIADVNLDTEMVSDALGLSRSTLNRRLKELGKPAINELIKEYRLQKAIIFLAGGYKVRDVSDRVGFKSPSYFTHCFKAHYHKTPTVFAKIVQNPSHL